MAEPAVAAGREGTDLEAIAAQVVTALRGAGETLATAESLTAGLIASTLAGVPGASTVLRGGLIAYASDLKHELAGVEDSVLAEDGAVSQRTAEQLARGARVRCSADLGISATGVAGPASQEGKPVGTVWIALADADTVAVQELLLSGDRLAIRHGTVAAALRLVLTRQECGEPGSRSE